MSNPVQAYRLYRRESVESGKWYHAISCAKCSQLIYVLDAQPPPAVTMVGDGVLATACQRCGHDGYYQVAEIKHVQSNENIEGVRPERVNISKSSRKPLLRNYPNAKATFGVGYIEDRPKAAVIVARIITSWADIEIQSARLLSTMMGVNIRPASAVFMTLRSSRTQHEALSAVAQEVLEPDDFDLFAAHIARKSALEGERNDLAHGTFGVSVAIPDHVVWAPQAAYIQYQARMSAGEISLAQEKFSAAQAVYELGTLERIAQEIEQLYHQLGFFIGYLVARKDPSPQAKAFCPTRYLQLCTQPHIAEALAQIRAGKTPSPNAQSAPDAKHPSKRKQRRDRKRDPKPKE